MISKFQCFIAYIIRYEQKTYYHFHRTLSRQLSKMLPPYPLKSLVVQIVHTSIHQVRTTDLCAFFGISNSFFTHHHRNLSRSRIPIHRNTTTATVKTQYQYQLNNKSKSEP